jgi:hypothetical protein|tara:strand:+ start:2590 stop:2754 length:165 start_codon:yes stop_codon:yes gene_type:complete
LLLHLLHLLWLLESTTQPAYTSTGIVTTTTRSVTSAHDLHLTRLYAEDAERHIG